MGEAGGHGRSSSRAALCAVLLLLLGAGGCGDSRDASTTARTGPAPGLMRLGARVFAEHCQTCHPVLGKPNGEVHDDAPPLDLDQVSFTLANARERIEAGGIGMSSFAALPAAEKRAVIAYVVEVSGREAIVPAGTSERKLARGERIYAEHCQRCHAMAGRPAHDPNPIWPGTDFEAVRPSVLYAEQKVREGQREAMPPFANRLSKREIRAVALYVNATAR